MRTADKVPCAGGSSRDDVRGKPLRTSRDVRPPVLAGVVMLLAFPAHPGEPVVIRLAPESKVSGERVRLGQVATIENATGPMALALADVDLGNAPGPGKAYRLKKSHVRMRVLQQDLGVPYVQLAGPSVVQIEGEGTVIAGEDLVERVIGHVRDTTGWGEKEARIRAVRKPPDLHLPPGDVDLEISRLSGDDYGMTLFVVTAWKDGFEVGRVPVNLSIVRAKDVVVAARTIPAGTVLRQRDLVLKRRSITQKHDETRYVTDPALLIGLRTRRAVADGLPLLLDMVDNPPVIRRGEPVRVQIARGAISVTVRGTARDGGRLGDRVRVQTEQGTELAGVLVERDLVEVR